MQSINQQMQANNYQHLSGWPESPIYNSDIRSCKSVLGIFVSPEKGSGNGWSLEFFCLGRGQCLWHSQSSWPWSLGVHFQMHWLFLSCPPGDSRSYLHLAATILARSFLDHLQAHWGWCLADVGSTCASSCGGSHSTGPPILSCWVQVEFLFDHPQASGEYTECILNDSPSSWKMVVEEFLRICQPPCICTWHGIRFQQSGFEGKCIICHNEVWNQSMIIVVYHRLRSMPCQWMVLLSMAWHSNHSL